MAKRGPKPKKKLIRRGRKIGSKVYQRRDWSIEKPDDDNGTPYDNSRFYEIARAYIEKYNISVSHAARLAVQIEYVNLKYAREIYGPISLALSKPDVRPKINAEYKEKLFELTSNVSVADNLRKIGWSPENEKHVSLIEGLPAPTKPWIHSNDPTVRRVAARIYRETKIKSKR